MKRSAIITFACPRCNGTRLEEGTIVEKYIVCDTINKQSYRIGYCKAAESTVLFPIEGSLIGYFCGNCGYVLRLPPRNTGPIITKAKDMYMWCMRRKRRKMLVGCY